MSPGTHRIHDGPYFLTADPPIRLIYRLLRMPFHTLPVFLPVCLLLHMPFRTLPVFLPVCLLLRMPFHMPPVSPQPYLLLHMLFRMLRMMPALFFCSSQISLKVP